MISGIDRTREALAAGATRFLNYDEWLRIGAVISDVLATQPYAAQIATFTYAIRLRCTVAFDYLKVDNTESPREIEPHLLGETEPGRFVMRGYTTNRGSRNPLREGVWETYFLDRMKNLAVMDRKFAPRNGESSRDTAIVRVHCRA